MNEINKCYGKWLVTAVLLVLCDAVPNISLRAAASIPPNVLLIVTDDQRPEHSACAGNQLIKTPNIDQLVRSGTVFTRAVCPIQSAPQPRGDYDRVQRFPQRRVGFGQRIDPSLTTWGADDCRRAGYHTWYVGQVA